MHGIRGMSRMSKAPFILTLEPLNVAINFTVHLLVSIMQNFSVLLSVL